MTQTPDRATGLELLAVRQARLRAIDGDQKGAAELLQQFLRHHADSVPALDLLARLRARAGDLDQAIVLWRQAAEISPASRQLERSLSVASKLQAIKRRAQSPVALVLVGLGALSAVVLITSSYAHHSRIAASAPAIQQSTASIKSMDCERPESLSAIGAAVRIEDRTAILSPTRPLFDTGAILNQFGAQFVTELGDWLGQRAGPTAITVVGYTDAVPFRNDPVGNQVLGARRAITVMRALAKHSGVRPDAFTVQTERTTAFSSPSQSIESSPGRTARVTITSKRRFCR